MLSFKGIASMAIRQISLASNYSQRRALIKGLPFAKNIDDETEGDQPSQQNLESIEAGSRSDTGSYKNDAAENLGTDE